LNATTTQAASPYQQQKNVVYAEVHGVGLIMDIFTPRETGNGLGIVEVASGGWSSDRGKIRDLSRAQVFDIFCGKGYTVFAVRPGSVSKFSASEMLDHVQRGIRWIKQRADDYGIDTARLGIMGASAGGHLASLVAVTNGRSSSDADASVAAAGIFFPPADFLDYNGRQIDPRSDDFLGQVIRQLAFPDDVGSLTDEQINQRLRDISPARRVRDDAPPFLLIHGDADPVVPLQQSRALLAALESHKVPVRLVVKEGGAHPWPTIHEEVGVMADWFDEQLGRLGSTHTPTGEATGSQVEDSPRHDP
jgi:acetyl esterase/lipase